MSESTPLIPGQTRSFYPLLATLWFGTFLAALDSTVVSTLMSDIASDLNALDSVSWVATAYLVAYSAFQPLYGKLSDIFGRKSILIISTVLFAISCQLCSMANSIGVLVVARLLNGIGAGGMMSMSVITVSDFVPSRSRGLYQGFGNLMYASGAAFGGFFGGIAQSYKSWRFAFSCQVPMCLVSLVVITFNMRDINPRTQDSERSAYERLDIRGSALLSSAVCLLMFGISAGGVLFPWHSWVVYGSILFSILLLVLFVQWEQRAIEPVLPTHILINRTILGNCITLFFSSGIIYTFMFYVPIYLSAVFNYSPAKISHRLIANFIGGSMGSLGAGYIIRATGKYFKLGVAVNVGLIVSSTLWFGMTLVPNRLGDTWWWQTAAYGIQGLSYFAILTISLVSMIAAVPEHQSTGTSAQYTFRGTGSSIVLACSGSIFNNVLSKQLHKRVTGKHADKIINRVAKSVDAIRKIPEKYQLEVVDSYRVAGSVLFGTMLALTLICLMASSTIEEHKLNSGEEQDET